MIDQFSPIAQIMGMIERGEKMLSIETFISTVNALEVSAEADNQTFTVTAEGKKPLDGMDSTFRTYQLLVELYTCYCIFPSGVYLS